MKAKLLEWIKRYAPAEVLSLITTMLAAGFSFHYSGSYVASALAGTWGGNIGYYGYIICAELLRSRKSYKSIGKPYSLKLAGLDIRGLLIEFGLAELADSFLVRPFLMYSLPILIGNFSAGILLAKIAADITFYIPAIFFYESNKKLGRKREEREE